MVADSTTSDLTQDTTGHNGSDAKDETSFALEAKSTGDDLHSQMNNVASTSNEIDDYRSGKNTSYTGLDASASADGVTTTTLTATDNVRKTLFGLAIVVGIAVSWVGATQFSQSTYSPEFSSASINVWFSTSWMLICYPVYAVGYFVLVPGRRNLEGCKNAYREAATVYGRDGLCWRSFLKLAVPFAGCWAVTNYMYVYALGLIAAADVTALFSSNTAFIYVLSWLWLHERLVLLPVRSFSVLMSIGGIVLISFSDGFEGGTALGISFAIGAAIGSAVYKVLFKRFIGNATSGQVSLFLSVLGIFNIACLWPFIVIFYYSGVETWSFDTIPWDFLCGSAALSVVFNFLVNFGIAVTFPLFIALGTVIGIPLNAVVDFLFRGTVITNLKIGGAVLVIVGFLIMLIPEQWQEKLACWTEGSCPCERRGPQDDLGVESHVNSGVDSEDESGKLSAEELVARVELP